MWFPSPPSTALSELAAALDLPESGYRHVW